MELTFLLLLGSIISSTLITILLKVLPKYGANTFHTIVTNYFVCIILGSLLMQKFPLNESIFQAAWLPYAAILSVFFIVGFNIGALAFQKFGMSVASVVQKMSLILSVSFAIWYYNEKINALKIIGILFALLAVWESSRPKKNQTQKTSFEQNYIWALVLTFLISAIIEIALQYIEREVASQATDQSFMICVFAFAGIIGLFIILCQMLLGNTKHFTWKSIAAGIILGIPNYFSMYLFMLVLGRWDGSIVFPINNMGIIIASTLCGVFLFGEKMTKDDILGVVLALSAIALLGFA